MTLDVFETQTKTLANVRAVHPVNVNRARVNRLGKVGRRDGNISLHLGYGTLRLTREGR